LRSTVLCTVLALSSCTGQPGIDWDLQIEVCTAIIETPEQSPRNRAVAYKNRGNAWDAKGDYDRAIDDFSAAIRLDPNYGIAYSNRGRAWTVLLELDRAIADFNEAIRINPKHANAYFNRGRSGSIRNTMRPTTTAAWPGWQRVTRAARSPTSG
jgi:tetratricopeptide (TPR) repeat protein